MLAGVPPTSCGVALDHWQVILSPVQVESKRIARDVLQTRTTKAGQKKTVWQSTVVGEEVRSVTVVVKGDVVGSVEALVGVLEQNQPQGISLNVLFSGVGAVSESDVERAASTNSE